MIRIALIELALFLLPFFLYWLLVVRARKGERPTWPWVGLSGAGLILAMAALLSFAYFDGEDPDQTYQPAEDTIQRELDPNIPAYRQ